MKQARTIAVILWVALFGGLWFWQFKTTPSGQQSTLQALYSNKLQAAFFSGFLTLAGFILSLKTNILLRLQKDLFDDPLYKKRVENATAIDGKARSRNEPLIHLGNFLVWTVAICLIASLTQVTLGLFNTAWAVAVCFATVGSAMVFIFYSWRSIRENLRLWFELLVEKEKEEASKSTDQ